MRFNPGVKIAGGPEALARLRLNAAAERARAKARWTLALPLAAFILPLLMLGVGARLAWDTSRTQAEAEIARLADAGAEYGERALRSYAVAAGRINDRLAARDAADGLDEAALHRELAMMVGDLRQAVIGFVVDRDGLPIASSHLYPVSRREPLADRDYFQALSRPDGPDLHISGMFVGRFDGRLLVALSRARRTSHVADPGAPGTFDGVTSISIDPNVLADGLDRILTSADDTLALVRRDGEIISRSTGQVAPLPPVPRASPFHALAAADVRQAIYEAPAAFAGAPGVVGMARVGDFPVYALVARPSAILRADWYRRMTGPLLIGVPATLMLILLSLLVRHHQLKLIDLNEALEQDVKRSTDRLERAQRYALVGTFEVDLRSGTSRRSAGYMAVHGLAPRPARETHADWLRRLHPEDRARAEATLVSAIADGSTADEYAQSYRIITAAGEVRWISARGKIERDASGVALTLRGVHVDVTSLRSTEAALAESDERMRLAQDAVGIGNWEWEPGSRQLHLTAKALDLLGFDQREGQPGWRAVLRRIVEADRRRVWQAVTDSLTSGQLRIEFRVDTGDETIWIVVRAKLVARNNGQAVRLLGVAYDVTDRKRAEQRNEMLAHEVEHRAKNAMALVLGLIRLTTADTHEEFVETLQDRISSLSRTIGLLGKTRWAGASITQLLTQELKPYMGVDSPEVPRIVFAGPDFVLAPEIAQPLSMAIHELTTNAAKYGALSVETGVLSIQWATDGQTVSMLWRERGGPTVTGPPQREGFGSALIRTSLEQQLGGTRTKHWHPDGLTCEITFPMPRS